MRPLFDDCTRAGVIPASTAVLCIILFMACHKPWKTPVNRVAGSKDTLQARPKASLARHFPKKNKKKKLYLTFDDGPNKGTANVLTIVQDEEVPASFFIIGEHVYASSRQLALWDSMHNAVDVALCSHSFTHAWNNSYRKFYQYPDSVVNDFKRNRDSLLLSNNIVRTPGRNIWRIDSLHFTDLKSSTAAADSLAKAGFQVMAGT